MENAENRLGIKLPQDYIEMVNISNAFPTCSNSVEPSFQKVEGIDFYRNFQGNVIDTWKEMGKMDTIVSGLERVIRIAGYSDEQQFLIIPPTNKNEKWN